MGIEKELGATNKSELEDLVGRLENARESLIHPDYKLTTGKQFGELWGTAPNNVSSLRRHYPDHWDGYSISLSGAVSMYIESALNRKNNFGTQGPKAKIEGFLERLGGIDKNISDNPDIYEKGLSSSIKRDIHPLKGKKVEIPLPETPTTKYEHALLELSGKDVPVYNPYMTIKEFIGNDSNKIFHPVWEETGQIQDWHKYKGQVIGVNVDFPSYGLRRLALDYSSPPFEHSGRLDLNTWGGHPNAPSPRK